MENIAKECRICLKNSGTISIYDKRKHITIIDAILSVTNIQILCNENYPNSICIYCLERIDSALNLLKDVECSESKLKQIQAASIQIAIKVETDENYRDNSALRLHEHTEKLQQIQIDSNQNDITNFKVESDDGYVVELPKGNRELNQTASKNDYKVEKDEGSDDTVDPKYNALSLSESPSESEPNSGNTKYTNLIIGDNSKTTEYSTKCHICGKELRNHPNLLRHLRVHTGERPYECDICYKNYSQKVTLLIHKRCHTKEQPFTCKVCHRPFSHSSSLKRHMPTHDTSPKLLRYKCDQCFKDFRCKNLLQMHMIIHSDVKNHSCGICGKGFHRGTTMNQHMRTVHFKEKKHICKECGKAFGELNNLKAHFRIHTGEKPFECKYCQTRFNRSCTLHRHIIRRHQHMTLNEKKTYSEGISE